MLSEKERVNLFRLAELFKQGKEIPCNMAPKASTVAAREKQFTLSSLGCLDEASELRFLRSVVFPSEYAAVEQLRVDQSISASDARIQLARIRKLLKSGFSLSELGFKEDEQPESLLGAIVCREAQAKLDSVFKKPSWAAWKDLSNFCLNKSNRPFLKFDFLTSRSDFLSRWLSVAKDDAELGCALKACTDWEIFPPDYVQARGRYLVGMAKGFANSGNLVKGKQLLIVIRAEYPEKSEDIRYIEGVITETEQMRQGGSIPMRSQPIYLNSVKQTDDQDTFRRWDEL